MRHQFLALLTLALAAAEPAAQTIVVLPGGAGVQPNLVFSTSVACRRNQYILRAFELSAAGVPANVPIHSLDINVVNAMGLVWNNLRISLGHTSAAFLPATSQPFVPGLTPVRNPAPFTDAPGWNTIGFDNPVFAWNGADNLIFEIWWENGTSVPPPGIGPGLDVNIVGAFGPCHDYSPRCDFFGTCPNAAGPCASLAIEGHGEAARPALRLNFAVFGLSVSSPSGPGSLAVQIANGGPGQVFLTAVTFTPGAYPNGWFFGVDIALNDLLTQINYGLPFFGTLDGNGQHTSSYPAGVPSSQSFYLVTARWAVDPPFAGMLLGATAPVSYVTP